MRPWTAVAVVAVLAAGVAVAQDAAAPPAPPSPAAAPEVGAAAPDFRLNDQDGHALRLSDATRDRWAVLAFFPKAMTPG